MTEAAADQPAVDRRGAGAGERLAAAVADVVGEEVRAVRQQLADAALPAGVASTTLLRVLETFLPRRLTASGLTVGYLAAAAVLGRMGLQQQLRAAGGSSARLADEVRNTVSAAAGRVVSASSSAAREAFGR